MPGEVSVTLAASSVEAFKKAKERIWDNIRKANPPATSIAETRARHEFRQAEQALQTWLGASVPDPVSDWADIFALPEDGRESRVACYTSVRGALRDMLGLAEDDDIAARSPHAPTPGGRPGRGGIGKNQGG